MSAGLTYYSDCRSLSSITNPILDNDVGMRYQGFLEPSWDSSSLVLGHGYGLQKTRANQALVYCADASKLFTAQNGYVGLYLNLPEPIVNGVYVPLQGTTHDYLIWGINVGKEGPCSPSFYARLTANGIEFCMWGSACYYQLLDTSTNLAANQDLFVECSWNSGGYLLGSFELKMILRINGVNVVQANVPTSYDSLSGLNFCILDTPYVQKNLAVQVKKIITTEYLPASFLPPGPGPTPIPPVPSINLMTYFPLRPVENPCYSYCYPYAYCTYLPYVTVYNPMSVNANLTVTEATQFGQNLEVNGSLLGPCGSPGYTVSENAVLASGIAPAGSVSMSVVAHYAGLFVQGIVYGGQTQWVQA